MLRCSTLRNGALHWDVEDGASGLAGRLLLPCELDGKGGGTFTWTEGCQYLLRQFGQ